MSNGYFRENYYFLRFQRGSDFPGGGGQLFPGSGGGVQMLISIETHITCDFPGGSGPPIPLLDLHMRFHNLFFLFQKETLAVASQNILLNKTVHLTNKTNV